MYSSWEHRNSKNHEFIIIFLKFWRSAAEAAACKFEGFIKYLYIHAHISLDVLRIQINAHELTEGCD